MKILSICLTIFFAIVVIDCISFIIIDFRWYDKRFRLRLTDFKLEDYEEFEKIFKSKLLNDFIILGISLILFVISFLGFLNLAKNCKNMVKSTIKTEYGIVYEYDYSYIFNDGSFLYNNEKYNIKIIKDIDNNKYVQITTDDSEENNIEKLNLPLKNN